MKYQFQNAVSPNVYQIIREENRTCTCCKEKHILPIIFLRESVCMGNDVITYDATHYYCNNRDIFYDDNIMRMTNEQSKKKAKEYFDRCKKEKRNMEEFRYEDYKEV